MEIEYAVRNKRNKISDLPLSYRRAMFRAMLKTMDTKSLEELKGIYEELIARCSGKRGGQTTKTKTSGTGRAKPAIRNPGNRNPMSPRVAALQRASDVSVKKSFLHALYEVR